MPGGGNFTFSGEVYADGEPLIGATVTEPGTSNGTITGACVAFPLRLSRRAAEVPGSFIGHETRTLRAQAHRPPADDQGFFSGKVYKQGKPLSSHPA